MDVSGQESDWRSASFRQKLVSQIEEAMRKAGVAHSKSSKDMESHVFLKAKTRVRHHWGCWVWERRAEAKGGGAASRPLTS
uniref:Mediator of RNA polymerase II transcription subunit 15 n=1 Tax=Vombatus ursinus TaxID=29139 RepID=A0A4X2M543_VOMUR